MRLSVSTVVAFLALALAGAGLPAAAQIAAGGQTATPPAGTLRELIDRYFEWRGGFALESLQTIHERLYVEMPAGHGPGALWVDRDGRMRLEIPSPQGPMVEVATPDRAWRSVAGGAPTDDASGAYEHARRQALLMFGDALAGRGGASVALAGTTDLDDHTWAVVRVTFGDADTYEALLDPANGWLCCYRITEGGVTRIERLGDWRLVDGVRMPFVQITTQGPSDGIGMKVSSIELNRPIDPALFTKPAG
jgi:hypothetical protein